MINLFSLFEYLTEKNKFKLLLLNVHYNKYLNIDKIKNIERKYIYNKVFLRIKVCDLYYKIHNIDHLINIRKIETNNNAITNILRKQNKLVYLLNNNLYCSINHMKSLKFLDLGYDFELKNFNKLTLLRKIHCRDQDLNLKYISKLRFLITRGMCQTNIEKLTQLKILNCGSNEKVSELKNMPNLVNLDCTGIFCSLSAINTLTNLKKLKCSGNINISNINNLTNLTYLDCSFTTINQDNIQNLTKIKKIKLIRNYNINNLNHMTNLRYIDASFSKINKDSILELKKIKTTKFSN